ncbi:leucine-rich repeat-containing G-protein coupled receptor 4-like isoform X2 [Symsagittifera roscoffensis]
MHWMFVPCCSCLFGLVLSLLTASCRGTVIGVCNCSIGQFDVLCGSTMQEPTGEKLFTDFESLHKVDLGNNSGHFLFSMSRCALDIISGTPFIKFPYLMRVQISENNITKLDSSIFANLEGLDLLNIQRNYIEEMDPGTFNGLNMLQTLDISDNYLSEVPEKLFANKPMLLKLVMSNNKIKRLSKNIFSGAPNLVELDLSWNKLESFPENFFTSVKNLQALNCANNEIKIFPQSLSKLEFLMHLDMSENHIKRVPPRIFANMKDLNYIDLSGNDLEEVGSGVFVGPGGTIKSLILAGNKIRTFPKSALQSLKWIRKLDLSNNSIRFLPALCLGSIKGIDTMDLSFNQIEDIDPSAFKEIPEDSALSLDLSHNSISYLTVVMFDELDNFRVNLAENKIRCNCAMERFYEWASQQDESKGFSSVMCLNPVGVRGIRLTDLRSKDSLVCAAPEIVPTTSEVQAQKGHQAYLPCYNTAEPLAQTSWSFKGNKVENNSKTSILEAGSLVIRDLTEQDAGVWTCMASNPRGKDFISVSLSVTDCNFSPTTSLTISLILFIASFILFGIAILICVFNKKKGRQNEKGKSPFELSDNNSLQYNQAPILPKQGDYKMPEFLQNDLSNES